MSDPEHEAEPSPEPSTPEAQEAGENDLATQLSETKDRLLRSQAELENFRRRSRRELDDTRKYAEFDLLRDLLPVLDNVHRAIQAAEKTPEAGSLLEGFRMLATQIEKLLEAHGCKAIETDGESFDPEVHEAILQHAVAGVPAGRIVGAASRGYRLHDRVVRPAQVIVATQPD